MFRFHLITCGAGAACTAPAASVHVLEAAVISATEKHGSTVSPRVLQHVHVPVLRLAGLHLRQPRPGPGNAPPGRAGSTSPSPPRPFRQTTAPWSRATPGPRDA